MDPASLSPSCAQCPVNGTGLFAELSPSQMAALDRGRVRNRFTKGQTLYYEGHHPIAAYCLRSGQVKVFQRQDNGRARLVGIAGPGDVLGHETLLRRDAYESSAEALGDCEICILPACVILPILDKTPSVLRRLLDHVMGRLHDLQAQHAAPSKSQPVSARLAALLVSWHKRFGRPVPDGTQIDFSLSRAEIATLIGTTTETTIRLLRRCQAKGILTVQRSGILVRDLPALQALAQAAKL